MQSKLDQLRTMTDVVADTGDIEAIRRFEPQDATTNPSLLLKAAALPHYNELLTQASTWAVAQGGSSTDQLANCCDHFAVQVGRVSLRWVATGPGGAEERPARPGVVNSVLLLQY